MNAWLAAGACVLIEVLIAFFTISDNRKSVRECEAETMTARDYAEHALAYLNAVKEVLGIEEAKAQAGSAATGSAARGTDPRVQAAATTEQLPRFDGPPAY